MILFAEGNFILSCLETLDTDYPFLTTLSMSSFLFLLEIMAYFFIFQI